MDTVRDVTRRIGGDLKDVKRDIAGFGRDVRSKLGPPVASNMSPNRFQGFLRNSNPTKSGPGFLPNSGRDFEELVNHDSDEEEKNSGFRIEDFELLSLGRKKERPVPDRTPFSMETVQDTLRKTERELDGVMRKADRGVDVAVRKTEKAFRDLAGSASRSSLQVVGKLKNSKSLAGLKVFP